jgi:hypothetical protein
MVRWQTTYNTLWTAQITLIAAAHAIRIFLEVVYCQRRVGSVIGPTGTRTQCVHIPTIDIISSALLIKALSSSSPLKAVTAMGVFCRVVADSYLTHFRRTPSLNPTMACKLGDRLSTIYGFCRTHIFTI